ncbi:MAG: adenosylcobinamide-GDP ribazoletransferase [Pseudomonadota bacterium]
MTQIVADTARAVSFLSRLPVPDRFFDDRDAAVADSSYAYAIAGVIVALPSSIVLFVLLVMGLAPLFACAIAITCLVITTGALHEDGLADCADGFWGGRERDSILMIMKDSSIGAYGTLALVMICLLRASGLAAIAMESSALVAALALIAVAAISRACMVWHWHILPAAKADGVAASAGRPDGDSMVFAVLSACVLVAVLGYAVGGVAGILSVFLLSALVCTGFSRISRKKIGGHTGDTIGATQLVCESAALLGLALWA